MNVHVFAFIGVVINHHGTRWAVDSSRSLFESKKPVQKAWMVTSRDDQIGIQLQRCELGLLRGVAHTNFGLAARIGLSNVVSKDS